MQIISNISPFVIFQLKDARLFLKLDHQEVVGVIHFELH